MTLPIRPEDYSDPNWCPDCGEPRGLCRCKEMPFEGMEEDWDFNMDGDYDDDPHGLECTCETCIQNHPERDILYGDGSNFKWEDEGARRIQP